MVVLTSSPHPQKETKLSKEASHGCLSHSPSPYPDLSLDDHELLYESPTQKITTALQSMNQTDPMKLYLILADSGH